MRQLRCFPQSDLIPMQRSIELGNGECLFFWICFQDYWPQDDPSHWSYNEESQATPWWHSYSLYVTSSWCIRTHQDLPRSCFIQWGHPSLAEHHWGGKPSSKHLAWRKCLVQPTTLLNRYQNASSGMDLLLMTSTEKGSLRMKVLGPWLFWTYSCHQWLDACIPKAVEEVQGQSTSVQAWLSEAKCVKRIVVVNGWPGGRKSKEAPLRSRCRSTVMVWSAPGKRIKKSALCDVSPLPIISNQLGFGIQPVILINSSMWKENR